MARRKGQRRKKGKVRRGEVARVWCGSVRYLPAITLAPDPARTIQEDGQLLAEEINRLKGMHNPMFGKGRRRRKGA